MPLTTQERRARIHLIRPWDHSTGPRTELGKIISSRNSTKLGIFSKNPLVRQIARAEREDRLFGEFEDQLIKIIEARAKGVNNGKS